jgi:hypothetical protein
MDTSSYFTFALSCLISLLIGLLIPQYFKASTAERAAAMPPSPQKPHVHHQIVMLDLRAKEELESRLGFSVSIPQAIRLLSIEDEYDCLLFAVTAEEHEDEETKQQRRWEFTKYLIDTGSLTEFPHNHMSGGETE